MGKVSRARAGRAPRRPWPWMSAVALGANTAATRYASIKPAALTLNIHPTRKTPKKASNLPRPNLQLPKTGNRGEKHSCAQYETAERPERWGASRYQNIAHTAVQQTEVSGGQRAASKVGAGLHGHPRCAAPAKRSSAKQYLPTGTLRRQQGRALPQPPAAQDGPAGAASMRSRCRKHSSTAFSRCEYKLARLQSSSAGQSSAGPQVPHSTLRACRHQCQKLTWQREGLTPAPAERKAGGSLPPARQAAGRAAPRERLPPTAAPWETLPTPPRPLGALPRPRCPTQDSTATRTVMSSALPPEYTMSKASEAPRE